MTATDTLAAQLRDVFGDRLKMVAAFGSASHTVAIVDAVRADDLDKCAGFHAGWKKIGLATPLLIPVDELPRAIDAFPLEFSEIITTRKLVAGTDLLATLKVPSDVLRRACEAQARSHLVHLRQGYIEAGGNRKAIAQLLEASKAPFRALVANIARLDATSADELISRMRLGGVSFGEALTAAERLVEHVDRRRAA
jgi:hypothetical protein